MKTSIISNLLCAAALSLSLNALAADKKKNNEADAVTYKLDAAIYKVANTSKVKLSVDKNPDTKLRILLKDRTGKVYYSEMFSQKADKYRRVFDLEDMKDGKYYFELYNKQQKLVKEVKIESNMERLISLQ
ncbi:DUF3244 domain-containing protein [Dyadobacter sandarakinus]|uniref:DUF3244 domain-containing protein n=1 Tax=Dyadobacter sandarakinus TaxID=2747268 RepID=A0ABX7IEV4_9BACT|nr:DUF3244 domain-containing protein [Dyadobacter sandarakinus]QRR03618.1 DUF3244 domain-containing protein [Dyadobacter sandarakinus]